MSQGAVERRPVMAGDFPDDDDDYHYSDDDDDDDDVYDGGNGDDDDVVPQQQKSGSSGKQNARPPGGLAQVFAPPTELIHAGDFRSAFRKGKDERKW